MCSLVIISGWRGPSGMAGGAADSRDASPEQVARAPRGVLGRALRHPGELGPRRSPGGPLSIPRGIHEIVVVLEIPRWGVVRLIGDPRSPPPRVGEVFRLELLNPREDALRGGSDRPTAQAVMEDLGQGARLRSQDRGAPCQRLERDERRVLIPDR